MRSLSARRFGLLALVALTVPLVGGAVRSVAQSPSATLPSSSVAWDGTLVKVTVGCELQTGSCTGSLSARAPGASQSDELVAGDYSVAAGVKKTLSFVPDASASKQLDSLHSVVVRMAPSMGQGDPFEATLGVEHRSGPGGGPPPPRSRKHPRYFTLGGFTEKNTLILWAGELGSTDTGTAKCVTNKLVKIQKRVGRRWVTVGRTRTTKRAKREHPGWSAKFVTKFLPLEPSRKFRAYTPRVTVGRQICLPATSPTVPGTGR